MDGVWTRNYESEADVVAPKLAKCGGAAGALYLWLHSRVRTCDNNIGISMELLSKKLGVSRRTLWAAANALKANGIISFETRRGNGGGTVFHLTSLSKFKCEADDLLKTSGAARYKASNGKQPMQQIGTVGPITKMQDFNSHADKEGPRYDPMISLLDRVDEEMP